MKRFLCPALLALALLNQGCQSPSSPSPARGAAVTGHYPNLFAANGHTDAEVKSKIDAAYAQLFHGDNDNQTVFYLAGTNANGPFGFVTDVANNDVRTEGLSYGMMIAVQLDHKADFDAIWNWARTFMFHSDPAHPSYQYFSWSMKTNGALNDEMVAPDGEEYFIMSLYFAANRWGSGSGIYDYRGMADCLLSNAVHRAVITGQVTTRPSRTAAITAGPIFNPDHKMVRFSPTGADHTDPSYHLPAFYELWAKWGPPGDRDYWKEAAENSRTFFQWTTNPRTGLAPNYANFDGSPEAPAWNKGAADFRFDAWRTAMNWSVDWSWWRKDIHEREFSDRLQAFFAEKGISTYGNQFTLDGQQVAAEHSTGLVAMNAVASLAATNPQRQEFVEALWRTPIPNGHYRYYDGLLYLMGLMHCGGEFRALGPP
ncbi:MAG TPA: glycosyl hydrolase family 8 [Verrucomicrobiae bacterium]|jgi:oligosaccharide reducing-end xylanase|nr:glycosyl hydrolase family 8 [Verrucomicrobiae bacterium]